jgi:Casein kinase II regulatory subunit
MDRGRALPNPRRLRPGQKFRWQNCKAAAAAAASRDLGPTLPVRVLPALLFLSFAATGPSATIVLVAAREHSPRHHESMGRKCWQPPTFSSSSSASASASSSSALEGADIRSVFRDFIEILQSCDGDGGGVDEYNVASDDDDDEQRVLDALEKLDRVNGNQTQSQSTVSSSSLSPSEYHPGLDDTRKYATTELPRQQKSKPRRRSMSNSIRTETGRTELNRGAASIRNSTSLRQSQTGLTMHEPLRNGTPDVASSPFKGTAPNIEVHPPTVSASQHPAVPSPSSSSSILLRQSRASVREYLASCRAVDGLVDVPLDFLADPFNLAQLAPVVEEIGQFWLRRQQQQQEQQQSSEALKAQPPAVAFPIYRQALHLLLTMESDDNEAFDSTTIAPPPSTSHYHVEQAAIALYFLVHQRYVASPRGLECVRRLLLPQRHESSVDSDAVPPAPIPPVPAFGRCPNLSCRGMPLLPCGDSDRYTMTDLTNDPGRAHGISNVGHHAHDQQHQYSSTKQHHLPQQYQHQSLVYANSRAKRYCPSCRQYFYHWRSRVDGCAWGPSFCHLFVMTQGGAGGTGIGDNWDDLPGRFGTRGGPPKYPAVSPSGALLYNPPTPRIFGYRLHPGWYLSASDNWCRHWEQRSAAATATAASAAAAQAATTGLPKPCQ